MGDKKIAEAQIHIRQAEKCLKTSLFKWNADLDGAAAEYVKAATCYRNAKCLGEAREAYVKAAEMHQKMNAPFHAAKAFEQAGLLSKENKEMDLAVQFMEKASLMFQEHGTPDTAALCLEKAAKMVEMTHQARAADLYKRASEVAELEDRPRQSAEDIGKAGRLYIRLQRYEEAIACLRKEIEFYAAAENYAMISKLVLSVVLIQLHLGDFVAADNFYRSSISYPQFSSSEEAGAVEELLQAYDDGNEDDARRVLSLPLIKYMDNAFAKLARDLVIPGGGGNRSRQAASGTTNEITETPAGGVASGGNGPIQLDDDEFEEGLS